MHIRCFRICSLLLAAFVSLPSVAQELAELEYWFDQDNGNRCSISLAGNCDSVSTGVATDGLGLGLHWLYMRVMDTDSVYSGISASPFLRSNPDDGDMIEYWFDDDYANSRTMQAGVDGTASGRTFMLDMDGVSLGGHRLYFRFADKNGNYGPVSSAFIVNTGNGIPGKLEYWLDDDISHSRFTENKGQAADSLVILENVDLSDVTPGMHRLYYRVLSDDNSRVGTTNMEYVMVSGSSHVNLDYWLDDANDSVMTISANTLGSTYYVDSLVDLSGADMGMHRLSYRISSDDGRYMGPVATATVMVMPAVDFFNVMDTVDIVSGSYWIDDSEPVAFLDFNPGHEVSLDQLVNLSTLPDGEHVLFMSFVDADGRSTYIERTPFLKSAMENTIIIDGILYKYYSDADEPFAAAIGYEEGLEKADIQSSVAFETGEFNVTSIRDEAFYGCLTMDDVLTIPSTVTSIGKGAFSRTNVSEVNLDVVQAPVIGTGAFPSGTNLRVPVDAVGYDLIEPALISDSIRLTYDFGCIYDSQWEALKRIDAMVRDHDGNTGWDFSDRKSTPAGVSRFGTDNVFEIDLSNHGLTGSYSTLDWTAGLPQISRIDLSGNSITDLTDKEGYGLFRLDEQRYDYLQTVDLSNPDFNELLNPKNPLILRDAFTGKLWGLNNGSVTYCLSTSTPAGDKVDDYEQDYSFYLTANANGTVILQRKDSNTDDVYYGKSGNLLCVTGNVGTSLVPNSFYTMQLYFADGDVDLNGLVDITDLQRTINYIFGDVNRSYNFAWNAANTFKDGIINVQDVVCTSNILLSAMEADMTSPVMSRSIITDDSDSAEAWIYVRDDKLVLYSDREIAALDVSLNANGHADWHVSDLGLSENAKDNHLVAYSFAGKTIPAGETVLADIKGGTTVCHTTLSDIDANMISVNINSDVTFIGNIDDAGEPDEFYNASGIRGTGLQHGLNIIRNNGSVKKVFINK